MKPTLRLTAALLACFMLAATTVPAQKKDESNRARGLFVNKRSDAMSLVILKSDAGQLVPVDPGQEFRQGDQIRIQFQSNFEGYVYVLNITPGGKRCILFPYAGAADNRVTADQSYDIPSGADMIEFNEEKGTEVLQVVMARERIGYFDTAIKDTNGCLSETAASAAAELRAGISKSHSTPPLPASAGTKVRSRDIILAPGKDKDAQGSVVAIPDGGPNGGKLKPGEIATFEVRLKHS
jgi:uncharacterized protein DUF4384